MATVELTTVSNVTGSPVGQNAPIKLGGRRRVATEVYTATAAPSNDDVVMFFGIPSHASLTSLRKFSTAVASGVADFGLFTYDGDGTYTAVDADLFATSVDISGADTTGTEIMHESGTVAVTDRGTRLWEMANAATDPSTTYYVGMTLTTAGTWSSDALSLTADYTID